MLGYMILEEAIKNDKLLVQINSLIDRENGLAICSVTPLLPSKKGKKFPENYTIYLMVSIEEFVDDIMEDYEQALLAWEVLC